MDPMITVSALTAWEAFMAALGTGALAALIWLAGHIISLSKKIDKLVDADQRQTLAIGVLAKLQRPSLAAHKATLEAIRDGKCNGNVTDAHNGVIHAFAQFDDFLTGNI